ncbi:hypothetical protein DYB26_012975, partial [Aphanomyces astaci]
MASHGNNEAADLEKRVKSPKDLEGGALTEGGALDLFSREALALFIQYGAVGIIYNIIPALRYPIFNIYLNLEGYQTSSYKVLIVIGWSFKVIFGLLSDCVPPELQYFNLSAPDNGTLFILLSMFIAFGYVFAVSTSDAMVVEYAQREPVVIRGRIQTAIYTVREITGSLAYLVSAFGLNGPNYGGPFSFALSPNAPYGIALAPCVLVVLST